MKTKLILITCALGILMTGAPSARASDRLDPAMVVADTIIVRPLCFVATIVGSAFFVVSLPIAATSHSVDRAADVLVLSPARSTFIRPLGDMEDVMYY